jgi:saccharopine dehydrogenase (NAD+, L-lysine-forming)
MSPSETTNLWLRCEKKKFEHRAALTPTTARALLDDPDHKFKISVEHDPERIFKDEEYEKYVLSFVYLLS